MKELLLVLVAAISVGGFVPYAMDVIKGKAKPARSTRLMFTFLLAITILQQLSIHSGFLIVVTASEAVGALVILALAIKRGVGGWAKLDILCYCLLAVDVAVWLTTGSAFIALHLSVLADLIAFTPTFVKTWRHPKSETPLFFVTGVVAPSLNILGAGKFSYGVLLFPAYLAFINLLEVL